MGSIEWFNLRWEGFEANIKVALRDVRYESEFSDVTLVAGDGKQVKANKVILAGGSSFFFNILLENPHPHPLIYLKGVSHDFLYTGEASIVEEDLNKFLDIAEDLKIRGLIPPGSQTKSNPSPSVPLRSQEAAEEPDPRVSYPHGATSTTPVSLQNQVAAKEHVTSPSVSHLRDDKFASIQNGQEKNCHDWYEQGEENNRMMQAVSEEDDKPEEDGRQEVVDSNCVDTTEAADNIFIHEQSIHACDGRSEDIYDMIPVGEQDINRNKCSICYKTFSGDLKRHKRTHTGEKQFECLVCFKRFSRMDTLKLHTSIHTGKKSHQCLQCSKKFSRKDRLNAHKAIHTHEQSYNEKVF